ncbi:MAG: DUF493 domain-containing protein [Brumimicrobium sp.]|nr:DUF493 domain-containing protein [Brumimicrobium sp.]MCO5267996.1 DUF493 domain-containing protein [Brumimicrobium sp.]
MEEKYLKLKEQLDLLEWPNVYMFKFIVPSDNQLIARVTNMFSQVSEISMRPSAKGNYTSITIKEVMTDSDSVIKIYQDTEKIKGVIVI